MQGGRKITKHFFIVIPIILVTSYLVWNVNVQVLQHNRNFYRTLNFHILEHDIIDVYWFGQGMVNYPINQYKKLSDVQEFFLRMHQKMSNFELLTYGPIDQNKFNQTEQTVEVYYKGGNTATFSWTLQDGLPQDQPFSFQDLGEIKAVLNQVQGIFFYFNDVDIGMGYQWDIVYKIQPFSDTSIFVHILSHQQISLAEEHILPFIFGVFLSLLVLWQYYKIPQRRIQNLLYYFLSFFLIATSTLAFSDSISFQILYMLDGVTCCAAWLCTIKFYLKDEDYNLTFLIGQCYAMIGRLFASFGPLLIAFAMFGYVVFSRYAAQFSSFRKTFLSLFYICYYNMTYESAMVTGRSNPISLIFFMTFVVLFTICIYSGMLVSVFCSYVWRKRQLVIRKDIENNLRIQCSSCDHKYKYADCQKQMKKKSFHLSEYLMIDFKNFDAKEKYKRIMINRIERLRKNVDELVDENVRIIYTLDMPVQECDKVRDNLWNSKRFIKNLLGYD